MPSFNTQSEEYGFRLCVAINNLQRESIVYTPPHQAVNTKLERTRRTKEIQRVIGERLTCLRMEMGITQTELGQKSGLSLSTISHLETGKSGNLSSLVRYTDAMNIPMSVILEGTQRDPKSPYAIRNAMH